MPEKVFEGRSKDRWNAITKDVSYINSKLTIGAFERAMTFEPEGQNKTERHRLLLNAARKLHAAFGGNTRTHMGRKQAVIKKFSLDGEEVSTISKILGRSYGDIHCLYHMFFVGQK